MDSNLTNIEEYFQEVGEEYNIEFDEFKKICLTPFLFIKEVMSSGKLKDIRLQYFGIFKVSPSRVTFSKKAIKENFDKGLISEDRFNKRMEVLNNYERNN